MAKTVEEANSKGAVYAEAWHDGYWVGYEDGESSAMADLYLLLDSLNLPFDINSMPTSRAIIEMAKLINEQQKTA